ncbi:Maltokinase [Nitrospira sp. KM1]|uniref:putative maltokinase n=1 Tax=Nitrospira sp. KM1 TaxID=1936990 RepID=UPI0013A71FAA|nr:putative maltokinase [Nitrospira sp. KM1]BCA55611.1 Maltokinase [Nitrospira sp. KM1]
MRTDAQTWEQHFKQGTADTLMKVLPGVLPTRRWFGSKSRKITTVRVVETIQIPPASMTLLLLVRVGYSDGSSEMYTLPLIAAIGEEAERVKQNHPQAVIAPLTVQISESLQSGVLYEATWNPDFMRTLLQAMSRRTTFNGTAGTLHASCTAVLPNLMPAGTEWEPNVMKGEQSNTSVAFNKRVIMKLFRRLEEGLSPDVEISNALTKIEFPYSPALAGMLEYQPESGNRLSIGVLQKFVINNGDAWSNTLVAIEEFLDRVSRENLYDEPPPEHHIPVLDRAQEEFPFLAQRMIGPYLSSAERLGRRTAELHLALSRIPDDPAFAPEAFTTTYRQAQYDSMTAGMTAAFTLLRDRMDTLSLRGQLNARLIFDMEPTYRRTFESFRNIHASVSRIRCHGDYHLGQVLCTTDGDYMIIDFEGEPARPLAERRMKHPPLIDVASMIRSFQYAPFAFLKGRGASLGTGSVDISEDQYYWARYWSHWTSAAFVKGYINTAAGTEVWPRQVEQVSLLLDVYRMEKAMYELRYELNNRPDWVEIPLHGLVDVLRSRAKASS